MTIYDLNPDDEDDYDEDEDYKCGRNEHDYHTSSRVKEEGSDVYLI